MIEVAPGKTEELTLQTCATRSANKVVELPYKLSYTKAQKLQPLLAYAADHLELSPGALQTAALAVTENLPLSAVAKFTTANAELKSRFTIVLVTHNMAQARRASDECIFMLMGEIIEHASTIGMFFNPKEEKTAMYIEGRYG